MFSDDSDVDENYEDLINPHENHGSREEPYDQDEESELHSVQVSNPWTIAKINAPLRQTSNRSANAQPLTPARQPGDVENIISQLSDAARLPTRALPSPERTQNASSEAERQSSSPEHFPYPLTARRQRADNLTTRPTLPFQLSSHRGALDTWVQKSQNDSQRSPPTNAAGGLYPNPSTTASPETQPHNESLSPPSQIATAPGRDFISARTLPTGTPLSEIPSLPQRGPRKAGTQRQGGTGINKPFISPVNDPTKVWFETESNPNGSSNNRTRSPQKRPPQTKNPDQSLFLTSEDISPPTTEAEPESRPLPHPDLAATLNYEKRKAAATQQHKQQQALLSFDPSAPTPKRNSPHTSRYNKAVAALKSSEKRSSVFEAGDARGYLLRQNQTAGVEHDERRSGQLRRRTAMLPLESISPETTTLELVLPLSIYAAELKCLEGYVKQARKVDDYAATGTISRGLQQGRNSSMVKAWEEHLRSILNDRYGGKGAAGEVEGEERFQMEIESILQEHLAKQLEGEDERRA